MMKKGKTVLQVSVFLAIAAGLIYWQFSAMTSEQLGEMGAALESVQYEYLIPVPFIAFLSHYFRAMRWQLMLKPIGIEIKNSNVIYAVLLGYLGNILLPRMGEVAKCSVLARYEKAPLDKLLGTIVSERIFDTLCLGLLFLLVFGIEYERLAHYGQELMHQYLYSSDGNFKYLTILILIGGLVVGLVIAYLIFQKIKTTKAGGMVQRVLQGVQSITKVQKRGLFGVYTIMIWTMYISLFYVVLLAVPATRDTGWAASMSVTSFGSIAMILTPGGIGAFPPICATILSFYEVPLAIGSAIGWLSWVVQTLSVLLLGLPVLALLPLSNKKNNEQVRDITE